MNRKVARWEAKGGKRWLELSHSSLASVRFAGPIPTTTYYSYQGEGQGGTLPDTIKSDEEAITWMERPWGRGGAGPVIVLQSDFPSVKRVS